MKNLFIILIVFLIVGGSWFFLNNQQTEEFNGAERAAENKMMEDSDDKQYTMKMEEAEFPMEEKVKNNQGTLVAKLEDVSGGTSEGTGYILREMGVIYHFVTADLPDPEGTNKYEGWLVKQQPELMFFSTGVMEKNELGQYELSYSEVNEEDERAGYNFVVITEETVIDETPEKHIIEGTAL